MLITPILIPLVVSLFLFKLLSIFLISSCLYLKIVRGPVIHSSFNKNGDGTWGENESFYVLDPDNHRIEIFCDMAVINKKGEYINTDSLVVPDTIAEEI